MTTFTFAAVCGSDWESSIALAADLFLAVEGSGESGKSGFDFDGAETSTSKAENEMKG